MDERPAMKLQHVFSHSNIPLKRKHQRNENYEKSPKLRENLLHPRKNAFVKVRNKSCNTRFAFNS